MMSICLHFCSQVCLILGVLMTPLFFWIETRVAHNPLLPLEVFTSGNGFVLACVACGKSSARRLVLTPLIDGRMGIVRDLELLPLADT